MQSVCLQAFARDEPTANWMLRQRTAAYTAQRAEMAIDFDRVSFSVQAIRAEAVIAFVCLSGPPLMLLLFSTVALLESDP